jgi:hypothetical protein
MKKTSKVSGGTVLGYELSKKMIEEGMSRIGKVEWGVCVRGRE